MSYCTACGQPRGGPAPFCTACGAPFAAPPAGSGPAQPGGPPPADDFFNSLFRPDPVPAEPDQTRQIPVLPGAGPDHIEPWPPPGPRRDAGRRRIVMTVGVLILLAAAATGAWLVFPHPHASGSAGAADVTHTPAASHSPSTATGTPTSSPTGSTGRGPVAVAPGVSRHAPEPRVVAFLGDYFTAINHHSYRRFAVLLGPQMRQTLPGPEFYAGYRTTTDSAATLTGLSTAGGGQVEADVAFTSHQAASDTPSHSGCTHWRITLVLSSQNGRLVLQPPPPGYHASYQAC